MLMSGYLSMKRKRKDLEEVNDDFSDSSPARKIRRLDAELPPIIEEEETEIQWVFNQQVMPEEHLPSNREQVGGYGPIIEELPAEPESEERAIVLFKSMSTPLLKSPSNFSVSIVSDIISGIKNQILWSGQSNAMKPTADVAARQGSNTRGTNECLAVFPWVPSQVPSIPKTEAPQTELSELMESKDMKVATMDIEKNNAVAEAGQGCESGGMSGGFHQWQQQHCMIPQLPQNASAPIMWFR
ncbi:Dol-P-Man:Man(5)GlcNAc(2)-PP-Dol alpha-1,3-mannosyltransferase [Actinidia chinensis var. chinensis]|uniref:Dol-P-Man:Man(5)GlcNAc(2)-PP-Dol alpha-1,3-mannosyltransferase n=1 Tax=Actinidia chinensis var. chinensis TaxID=1590841 RepID=A0A2R6Q3Y6_ACTCC|nr:Dol-P-Man:Man(5)GlcNAc(2)-PP-Dol alpha-1,3-mannosyltransferase [Actinidia chinensis var. chinensis]